MTPNPPMTEGEALAVDVGALHDAAKFLAGRYSDHDGWVVAIRAAASALTAHTAASGGQGQPECVCCEDCGTEVEAYCPKCDPPAAVPAGALERLVADWAAEIEMADEKSADPFMRGAATAQIKCRHELAALIPKGADHEQR